MADGHHVGGPGTVESLAIICLERQWSGQVGLERAHSAGHVGARAERLARAPRSVRRVRAVRVPVRPREAAAITLEHRVHRVDLCGRRAEEGRNHIGDFCHRVRIPKVGPFNRSISNINRTNFQSQFSSS